MPRLAKVKWLHGKYTGQLKKVFVVDVENDNPCVHVMQFCHLCQLVLHKALTEKKKNTVIKPFPLMTGVNTLKVATTSVTTTQSCREAGSKTCKRGHTGCPLEVIARYCSSMLKRLLQKHLTIHCSPFATVMTIKFLISLSSSVLFLWLSACTNWACCLWVYCVGWVLLYVVN